ncbi:coiled-coil domain-containing protein 195 [Tenrec ecaudatus]|uniref:coiled-coil domain-containing protein 195 n=1 Tax=Tenrec ecaudatus TaxID=94439 RepID=UPI003F5940DD
MEANSQLLGVIQEMQAEINKLEQENEALRMKLTSRAQGPLGLGEESAAEREEEATDVADPEAAQAPSLAAQAGRVSANSAKAPGEHQENVMIVRRYSISLCVHSLAAMDPWKADRRYQATGILADQDMATSVTSSSGKHQDSEEKMFIEDSSQRVFPKHVFGCRDKIKTVSFVLPKDMPAYSMNPKSLKCSPNLTTHQLSTILE